MNYISSIIKYFTHLNVKLELGEEDKNLMIIFYGNENIYDYLADNTNYELQLKPYAYKYVLFEKEFDELIDMINNETAEDVVGRFETEIILQVSEP